MRPRWRDRRRRFILFTTRTAARRLSHAAHGRAGWGTRYGTATGLLEAQLVGGTVVFGGGGELVVFLQHRKKRNNLSLLMRSTYSVGDRENSDARVFEISPGIGFARHVPHHGPVSVGLYAINHRVVDPEDRVGWAHGVAVMFFAPISGVIAERKRAK